MSVKEFEWVDDETPSERTKRFERCIYEIRKSTDFKEFKTDKEKWEAFQNEKTQWVEGFIDPKVLDEYDLKKKMPKDEYEKFRKVSENGN